MYQTWRKYVSNGSRRYILTNFTRDRTIEAGNAIDALPGHLIFWAVSLAVMLAVSLAVSLAVMLAVMLADDVAMLAFMFC